MVRPNGPAAPLRVLVVDPDADTAESLAEVLALNMFAATSATTGEAAARAVAADPPDVIITDLVTPGVDAFNLARLVRERRCPKRPCSLR